MTVKYSFIKETDGVTEVLVESDEQTYESVKADLRTGIFFDHAREAQRRLNVVSQLLPSEISDIITTPDDT